MREELIFVDDLDFTLDSEYAEATPVTGVANVIEAHEPRLEFRVSTNNGSPWTDWEDFIPAIRTLNAVQFRLTLNRPSGKWVPQVTAMNIYLVDY